MLTRGNENTEYNDIFCCFKNAFSYWQTGTNQSFKPGASSTTAGSKQGTEY